MPSYLVPGVERFKLILEHLLGVDTIIAALKGIFVLEGSVFKSKEDFDERSDQVRDMGGEDVDHQSQTESLSHILIPFSSEVRISAIEDRDKP